jgi:hypothetical protein
MWPIPQLAMTAAAALAEFPRCAAPNSAINGIKCNYKRWFRELATILLRFNASSNRQVCCIHLAPRALARYGALFQRCLHPR